MNKRTSNTYVRMCDARRSVRDMIADDSHQRKVRTGTNRIIEYRIIIKTRKIKRSKVKRDTVL
jgi:hypothetical protein